MWKGSWINLFIWFQCFVFVRLLIIYDKIKLKLQTRHYVNEFVHKSINFL